MRRTAGIGYWNASSQDENVLGSGASPVSVAILGVAAELATKAPRFVYFMLQFRSVSGHELQPGI